MKPATLLAALALALSLAALILSQAGTDTAPESATGQLDEPRLASVTRRLDDLEQRLATLALQLDTRPAQPLGEASLTRADLDAVREELASAAQLVPPTEAVPVDSPAFKEQVASTLAALRREEAIEKTKAYHDQRSETLEETMPRYQEWLGLSDDQTDRLQAALEQRYEREAALVRLWEDGVDDELLGTYKRNDWDTFTSDVSTILDEQQLETYLAAAAQGK